METNDQLVKQFIRSQKQEIANNGFSTNVMRKLPDTPDHSWIIWVFAALGAAISIYYILSSGLMLEGFLLLTKSIPLYYFLGALCMTPLLGTAGYYLFQNRNYRLI